MAAAQALRRPTRLLVVLALLLGTAYAAELVATGPSASNRKASDALARATASERGHDRATATSANTACEGRRIDALKPLLWRVLHGYVPRRGPPALRLT